MWKDENLTYSSTYPDFLVRLFVQIQNINIGVGPCLSPKEPNWTWGSKKGLGHIGQKSKKKRERRRDSGGDVFEFYLPPTHIVSYVKRETIITRLITFLFKVGSVVYTTRQ